MLDLASHGVAIVGPVPTGYHFVSWSGITVDDLWTMVPGALGIVVVGFAQSLAIAKSYAAAAGETIDPNQELIGYGAASIGAGVLQGYTPTGSLSKTAAAKEAGAKTPVSFVVTALLVVLTTLFLAGFFENLPEAVLGAIVIHAVWGMIDFSKLTRLWRAHIPDFWLSLGALLGVVLVGILAGIVIGIVLSLVLLIHRFDHPRLATLGRSSDGTRYEDEAGHPEATQVPGIVIVRIEAPFIFANADVILDRIRGRIDASSSPCRAVIVDFEAVYEIDTQGADALQALAEPLESQGVKVVLARVHQAVLDYLARDGSLSKLGGDATFGSIEQAVASLSDEPTPTG